MFVYLAAVVGLAVMSYYIIFGLEDNNQDPDFSIYTKSGAHWSEEIGYYGDQMNKTLPILPLPQNNNTDPNSSGHLIPAPCCRQFGEGQEWGDIRK